MCVSYLLVRAALDGGGLEQRHVAGAAVFNFGLDAVVARGAQFIVSPGFDPIIVSYCIEHGIFVLPGCVTPTEITAARNAGLGAVKFFPAVVYGGIRAITALAAPFSGTKFVPTGGIDAGNLAEYLVPDILAVGGGWLCDKSALIKGDFSAITDACAKSMRIVAAARGSRID